MLPPKIPDLLLEERAYNTMGTVVVKTKAVLPSLSLLLKSMHDDLEVS